MLCRNHPETQAVDRCAGCMEPFCGNCLVTVRGRKYCAGCKVMAVAGGAGAPAFAGATAGGAVAAAPVFEAATEPCPEANEALKYAIIGIFCFGIILEPIAISKALKAKKMIAANPNLTGGGKATAALIIAIVGLVLWVLGLMARFSGIN
jgi:hypothetical protein